MDALTRILGEVVHDPEEETFVLFSQDMPCQSLGFLDSQADILEINVAGHDLTIHQSRGLLTSRRKAGTTGAVVWKVTPLFASWICSPGNFLFTHSLLTSTSTAVELGAGVSGINALTLGPKLCKYVATDQDYVLKLLKQNIIENENTLLSRRNQGKSSKKCVRTVSTNKASGRIQVQTLDWEHDDVSHLGSVSLVIACDCIYNESLIEPFNSTCAAICKQGPAQTCALEAERAVPTLCIVAQQLRSPDVFEAWMKSFHRLFRVWRVPDALVDIGLREGSGFVVHVGVVRGRQEVCGFAL